MIDNCSGPPEATQGPRPPEEGNRMIGKRKSSPALAGSLASLLLLAACAGQSAYIPMVGANYRIPSDFKIVGYFPSWSGDPKTIRYRDLTHVCYAFASPTSDGGYAKIDNEDRLIDVVTRAHAERVKVLLSLGGGGAVDPDAFDTIAADPALTAAFVENTMDLLARYCLDGIDMDWEFPGTADAQDFANLMHALSERIHGAGRLLSVAVSATNYHGKDCLDSVIDDVDFLNIMAYDDGYKVPGAQHSTYWFAKAAMDYWLDVRRVPPSKAILGVPFYGRSLKNRHSISYSDVLESDPWASSSDVSSGFGYNGFDTLRAKAVNLARVRGGGIMIWQLNQDAEGSASLLNAIFDAIKEPVEPVSEEEPAPVVPEPIAPAPAAPNAPSVAAPAAPPVPAAPPAPAP